MEQMNNRTKRLSQVSPTERLESQTRSLRSRQSSGFRRGGRWADVPRSLSPRLPFTMSNCRRCHRLFLVVITRNLFGSNLPESDDGDDE